MLRKTLIIAALLSPLVLAHPVVSAAVAPVPQQEVSQAVPVNINTADAQQLAFGLTGVGLKRAQDIIKLREQVGQFSDINQLMQVKGIGPRMIELNKDRIVL